MANSRKQEIMGRFAAMDLDQLQLYKLESRYDVKFIFHSDQLDQVLSGLGKDYRILKIKSRLIHPYETEYYDTRGHSMYLSHHNGVRPRYKIRRRDYLITGTSFYEIKRRDNKGYLTKHRQEAGSEPNNERRDVFIRINSPYDPGDLKSALTSKFNRITLMKKDGKEKITIDQNIEFRMGKNTMALPGIIIAELKTPELHNKSQLELILRSFGIHPLSISKYLTGIALMKKDIKQNLVKDKLRTLKKIQSDPD